MRAPAMLTRYINNIYFPTELGNIHFYSDDTILYANSFTINFLTDDLKTSFINLMFVFHKRMELQRPYSDLYS